MTVKFSKSRKVRVFPKAEKSEASQLWWCATEFEKFHKTGWRTIDLVRDGANLNKSNSYCPRGLEHWMEDKRQNRQNRRLEAVRLVLDEQKKQRREGIEDPVAMARIYEDANLACQFEAHVVGLRDEDEVKQLETAVVPPPTETRRKRSEKRPLCIDGKSTECLRKSTQTDTHSPRRRSRRVVASRV